MFMGTYNNSIDAKNRMIVPSKHRDQLGGKCVITRGLDRCLYIYTLDEWEKQAEKISQLPEADKDVRNYVREIYSNADEVEFDKQGRIVIPAVLKEYAEIEKELVTVGAMKKIEVWSKKVWEDPSDDKYDTGNFGDALAKYNF